MKSKSKSEMITTIIYKRNFILHQSPLRHEITESSTEGGNGTKGEVRVEVKKTCNRINKQNVFALKRRCFI